MVVRGGGPGGPGRGRLAVPHLWSCVWRWPVASGARGSWRRASVPG